MSMGWPQSERIADAAVLPDLIPRTRLHAGLILCCYRGLDASHAIETIEIANQFREFVYGVDLAGDESIYDGKPYQEAFRQAQNYGLPCTIHAAEAAGPASVAEALDTLGARRIGHGVRLREDSGLLKRVIDEEIPLEMCITSNVHTGAVSSLAEHPFRDYLDRGAKVTINTDDPGVSGITLSNEWEVATEQFRLSRDETRSILENSLRASFAPPETRERMRRSIERHFN